MDATGRWVYVVRQLRPKGGQQLRVLQYPQHWQRARQIDQALQMSALSAQLGTVRGARPAQGC
jgi:hypothetical protein